MLNIAVVGCTGKLGSSIMRNILKREDVQLGYAIARKGNQFVGKDVSCIIGGNDRNIKIIDDIEAAKISDVFIDCTSAEAFMGNSLPKYEIMKKPVVIGTTAFSDDDMVRIRQMSDKMPVFKTGNFSIALFDFIETMKFAARRISSDTDVQIVEYHHNQKKDAPSGTAIMIRDALIKANDLLTADTINICSVRGGNIFGEHEVIFANSKDEVTTYRHQVSSRETFADGAIEVSKWVACQDNGLYDMENFASEKTVL